MTIEYLRGQSLEAWHSALDDEHVRIWCGYFTLICSNCDTVDTGSFAVNERDRIHTYRSGPITLRRQQSHLLCLRSAATSPRVPASVQLSMMREPTQTGRDRH